MTVKYSMPALGVVLRAYNVQMEWGEHEPNFKSTKVRLSIGDVYATVPVTDESLSAGTAEPILIDMVQQLLAQRVKFEPFPAKYAGTCVECERRFEPGTLIRLNSLDGREWRHSVCPPDEEPDAAGALCSSCFTYHRGPCI